MRKVKQKTMKKPAKKAKPVKAEKKDKKPKKIKAKKPVAKAKKEKKAKKSKKIKTAKPVAKKAKKEKKIKKAKKIKPVKVVKPKKVKKRKPASAKALARQGKAKKEKVEAPKEKIAEKLPEFSAESLFKAKIKVIGLGGGGTSIVSEIGKTLSKATFVVADTDMRALRKKRPGIKDFLFGEELTHGLGTGVNVDIAKEAAERAKEKLSSIFKDQDIVVFIASLGGGVGSGATQVFAEVAKEFGGITLGIFTMPFKFEGKIKARIAQNALKNLRQSLNVSITIPNERIFKIIGQETPITEAFSMVNKNLIGSLESLIDLIYNPGVINIDFADLRTILKGRGNLAFLNTVEETGKDRAQKICETVAQNPLFMNTGFTAEKIMFNISGADNLSMFEVQQISSHISSLNPKAKIIFGISKNPKLKNKIKTTILMTGPGQEGAKMIERDEEPEESEPVKEAEPEREQETEAVAGEVTVLKRKTEIQEVEKKTRFVAIRKKEKNQKEQHKPKEEAPIIAPAIVPLVDQRAAALEKKLAEIEADEALAKKGIRRSALEIKKAQDEEVKRREAQEKEWEIPAFLRKVKAK